MNVQWVISAFILGLGGSLHCLGMCGPLIVMMPFKSPGGKPAVLNISLYFLSKALMYGGLGLVIGLFGFGLKWMMGQRLVSLLAGGFILAVVLWPLWRQKLAWPAPVHRKISDWFYRWSSNPRWYHFIGLGMANALLPCVMILAAAGASAATVDPFKGFLFMLVFGLGTAPALIAAWLTRSMAQNQFRLGLQTTSKWIAILLGVVLLLRGLQPDLPHSHHSLINQVTEFITCKVPE